MKTLNVILIGAGNRGEAYTDVMLKMPDKFKVVGVADPVPERCTDIRIKHGFSQEFCFDSWEKILDRPKFADVAIISTMDKMHFGPAMKAIELGYDILLEKPISPSAEECMQLASAAQAKGVKIMVCHVLRFTPYFRALKSFIDSGKLGKVMSINHIEEVGIRHQAHSFVRGNWGNKSRSTFMLLAKSCHDMDIIQWLVGKNVKKIQSFGGLTYFTKDNAPNGAPERCIDGGCPIADSCIFNSVKAYLESDSLWFREAATMSVNPSDELVEKALQETQYGKCVFKCDNDVVDHQTVNMEFEDGTTGVFTMNAFSGGTRQTIIYGTRGQLASTINSDTLTFTNFEKGEFYGEVEEIKISDCVTAGNDVNSGHGGGDNGIVETLYDYITGLRSANEVSEIGISAKNHLLSFAGEESRLNGTVIDLDEFEKSLSV